MKNIFAAGALLALVSACGQTSNQLSEVQSVRAPITSACQLKNEMAFKCDLVNGEKISVVADNGYVVISGKKVAEYNVIKSVDSASGNVSYKFVNLDDSKAAPVTISTGKNGKGIGAAVLVKNGRTIACKFEATRDTAVLNFLAQNNGVCHPR